MSTRHKKVVDIPARLNVSVAHYFPVDLSHERAKISDVFSPHLLIKIGRSPGIDLISSVIV